MPPKPAPAKSLPTLSGRSNKQRKKNIVVPSDPDGFLTALHDIFIDNDNDLKLVVETLIAQTQLDVRRYAEYMFDYVLFDNRGLCAPKRHDPVTPQYSALTCPAEDVQGFSSFIDTLSQRKPFLKRMICEAFNKIVDSLGSMTEWIPRAALISAHLMRDNLLTSDIPGTDYFLSHLLTNVRSVEDGIALQFVVAVLTEYTGLTSDKKALSMLKATRVISKMKLFLPFTKRDTFGQIFSAEGLEFVVLESDRAEVAAKRKARVKQIKAELDQPDAVRTTLTVAATELDLDTVDTALLLWDAVAAALPVTKQDIVKAVEGWAPLLAPFSRGDALVQGRLLMAVQAHCYGEPTYLNFFGAIVQVLYSKEVIDEEVIMIWYKETAAKGATTFKAQLGGFITWLEQAEEEE